MTNTLFTKHSLGLRVESPHFGNGTIEEFDTNNSMYPIVVGFDGNPQRIPFSEEGFCMYERRKGDRATMNLKRLPWGD